MPNNIVNAIRFFGNKEYLEEIRKDIFTRYIGEEYFNFNEKVVPIPKTLDIKRSDRDIKAILKAIRMIIGRHPSKVSESIIADLKRAEQEDHPIITTDAKEAVKALSDITEDELRVYVKENPDFDKEVWKLYPLKETLRLAKQVYRNLFNYGYTDFYGSFYDNDWCSKHSEVCDFIEENGLCSFSIYLYTPWPVLNSIFDKFTEKYPCADIIGGFADIDLKNAGFYATCDCKVNGISTYSKNDKLIKEIRNRGISVSFNNEADTHKFAKDLWNDFIVEFKPKRKVNGTLKAKIIKKKKNYMVTAELKEKIFRIYPNTSSIDAFDIYELR